nr:hypothetical protein F09E10.9 - Caenorhabditis elegans [Caenorhabditis elegans]
MFRSGRDTVRLSRASMVDLFHSAFATNNNNDHHHHNNHHNHNHGYQEDTASRIYGTKDQQGTLNEYTGKGIDLLERIMAYSKERASIELEYSSKLKKLLEIFKHFPDLQNFAKVFPKFLKSLIASQ